MHDNCLKLIISKFVLVDFIIEMCLLQNVNKNVILNI